ncbi:hypothetical protein OG196_00010 [Kitasatospora purpeofusca]|uniref:hypothetical protein n=1 Tax=Kitasatospora purpeofusca TaxID=67352 RepID=UPI002E124354|nr:hypothetical protein OG196_00010 [Kitasatospora purpeofusca]
MHSLILDGGHLTWAHAIDHVRALEHDLRMQPPPVWSPLTLTRVVLEGAAFTRYLYDPAIPLAQRLARCAGMCVTEALNEAKASHAFGPEEQQGAQQRQREAKQLLDDADAVERRDRNGRNVIGYSIDGEYAPLDHKIGPQIKAFMPEWSADAYPLLSGAAHGRPWMIARARKPDGWGGEAATVMAAIMVVMGAIEAGITVWGGYVGANVDKTLDQMEAARLDFFRSSLAMAYPASQ